MTWLGDVSRAATRRRIQSRRAFLPAERAGRLRHRAAGGDGRGQADCRRARRRHLRKSRRTPRLFEPDDPEVARRRPRTSVSARAARLGRAVRSPCVARRFLAAAPATALLRFQWDRERERPPPSR